MVCLARLSCAPMPIIITSNLAELPRHSALRKLAEAHQIHVTGNETAGNFSGRGAAGSYEFTDASIQGRFTAYGVSGDFLLEPGMATVRVTEKPFWMPGALMTQKIRQGLEALCTELG